MAKNSIFAPMIKLNIQTIKRWANIMVNPGESRNEYDNKKPSSWDIDQFKSWFEDQLDSKGHPSQLLIKMLGVPDEDLFEEWSIGPTGLNNDKNWKKYQNFGGAVYDIWEYIQKYLPKTESKMTKKQMVENKIREIVKNVLKEAKVNTKQELPKCNLLLRGFGKDVNGNSIIKLEFYDGTKFSIQTNANLSFSHSIAIRNNGNLDSASLKKVRDEIVEYIKDYGTKTQQSKLKTYGSK